MSHSTTPERRSVTASGSITLDLSRVAEQLIERIAAVTAARVIQYLNARPVPQPPTFRPVEPAPAVDPALREQPLAGGRDE